MTNIYLTQKTKEEIEAMIVELESNKQAPITSLKTILSSAIILPVEESWDKVHEHCYTDFQNNKKHEDEDYSCTEEEYFKKSFPNGVIIQSKHI